MWCLAENIGADIDYVESVRDYCALAGVPERAVAFIERHMSKQEVREVLLQEQRSRIAICANRGSIR
jgi:hypothetical protein